jgi:hypothetical protein
LTATKDKPAPAQDAAPLTIEQWAELFAAARAYVPVAAMTSEAGEVADKFNTEQAGRVARHRDALAIRAEEWDDAEAARRREWDVPPLQPGWSHMVAPVMSGPAPLLAAPAEDPGDVAQERAAESLAEWAHGETLADEKADEAVENLLDIHDTDPAGETAVLDLPGEEE